jgi:hypothetical protein
MDICYDGFISVIVYTSMTLMKSGCVSNLSPAEGFEPVGWCQGDCLIGQHGGQAGGHVGEVFIGLMP